MDINTYNMVMSVMSAVAERAAGVLLYKPDTDEFLHTLREVQDMIKGADAAVVAIIEHAEGAGWDINFHNVRVTGDKVKLKGAEMWRTNADGTVDRIEFSYGEATANDKGYGWSLTADPAYRVD